MFKRFSIVLTLTLSFLFSHFLAADQAIYIFLGAPGAGKESISQKLSESTSLPHISTGDLLRKKLKDKGELKEQINAFVAEGEVIPDELILKTLMERLQNEDCSKGFILEGFPRTLAQAKKLEEIFPKKDHIIVVNISIGANTILERLQGRRVCQSCSKSYHITFNPPQAKNKCDDCSDKLISSVEDNIETIQKRLEIYKAQYDPIKQFYKSKYQWIDIKNDSIDDCFANLLDKIELVQSPLELIPSSINE